MKKTINITISGIVFSIEEDAYELLNNYIEQIKKQFSDPSEREEIVNDIETRIAELFQERMKESGKDVVTIFDVEYIKDTMGSPNMFNEGDDNSQQEYGVQKKRLYRLKDEGKFSGVCEGLGAYFGIDPVVIRILFVISIFWGGMGVLAYIVMTIAVPEAKTLSEKMKVKGEPITVENIKNQFEQAKNNAKDLGKKGKAQFESSVKKSSDGITTAFRYILKIIGIFILFGCFMFVGSLAFGFLSFSGIPLTSFSIDGIVINELSELIFESSLHRNLVLIPLFLLITIPVLYIIYFAILLVFDLKRKQTKAISISLLLIWLISIPVFMFGIISFSTGYTEKEEIVEEYELPIIGQNIKVESLFKGDISIIQKDSIFSSPDFRIVKTSDSIGRIKISKSSRARFSDIAYEKASNIGYKYQLDTNLVKLSPYYSFPKADKIMDQDVDITLYIPENVNVSNNEKVINKSKFKLGEKTIKIDRKISSISINVTDND